MYDLEILMNNEPGELARMGETLGAAGHSIEGGGMWVVGDRGVAHFLFEDGLGAQAVLEAAGFVVPHCRPVIVQRLKQEVPGQLGSLCRRMAEADVNIDVLYSDHDHQLVVAVAEADTATAQEVARAWGTSCA